NLSQLIASQTSDKAGLGYDNQVTNSTVFDCDEIFSSESDVSMPTSIVYDRYKSGEGYHVVPPPYTGTFMPPKPDLVFYDALTVDETVLTAFNVEPSTTKPNKDLPFVKPAEHSIPADNLRKDIPKSRGHGNNRNIKTKVHHQRLAKHGVNKAHSHKRRPINLRPSPPSSNFHPKVTTAKAPQVNAVKSVKGNWAWEQKCPILDHVSRHTSASMTLKQFDYTDSLSRSKLVMAWVPKIH
nr:hypothetical protein [Tanacetum cinerariifolium]